MPRLPSSPPPPIESLALSWWKVSAVKSTSSAASPLASPPPLSSSAESAGPSPLPQHMKAGGSIINTASIQADKPSPSLLGYATTKGAVANFTAGLAQIVAESGIRVNAVAPGPVWTPLIPATMPAEKAANFGKDSPLGRPAQPAELAGAYVFFASNEATYISGAILPITGGKPFL